MKRILFILFSILLLCSCQVREKDKISDLVKEWDGKSILLPKSMNFYLFEENYYDSMFFAAGYKVLTYVDSSGCFLCKLQFPKWKKLIVELDSVPILFNISPRSVKEIQSFLRQDNFNYPVCIDEADSLNKLNHFPSEATFQTFLLDKNNKVVAIGNPINNPKVKELYLKIILGDKAPKQKKEIRTTLKMNHSSVDMGSFDWQKEQRTAFTFTNTGTYPLVIVDVTTSCGCTSAEYPKEPIAQGKDAKIEITYKADHPEHFDKTITVYCNAENSPVTLRITGNAK